MTQPTFLQPGDKIALVSPAYHAPEENVAKAAEVLHRWGFDVVVEGDAGRTFAGRYAGTPEERAADLLRAFEDPSVKAILCNRGGYGALHLLDRLSPDTFSAHPKWLVGFSDITTLHGLLSHAGVMSIHGTMSNFLAAGGQDETSTRLRDLLLGRFPHYKLPAHPANLPGHACGTLVGGNLTTLTPLLGTSADPTARQDIILFLEEVEETYHNIDRQVNILRNAGVLSRCRGIILGDFTDCNADLDYPGVEEMLRPYLEPLGIPVLCGFPAGHGPVNLPLVLGATVSLDVRPDTAEIDYPERLS